MVGQMVAKLILHFELLTNRRLGKLFKAEFGGAEVGWVSL